MRCAGDNSGGGCVNSRETSITGGAVRPVRFDVEHRDDRMHVRCGDRAGHRRQGVAGHDLVRYAAQQHAVVTTLEANDAIAGRSTVIAGTERGLGDLLHEQNVLVHLAARNLEQQRSPMRWTLNNPVLVCACDVTTRPYGCGKAAPAAPAPPRPARPPPAGGLGFSLESEGVAGKGAGCCWAAERAGAGVTEAGAGVLAELQPIATTAKATLPRIGAERVCIETSEGKATARSGGQHSNVSGAETVDASTGSAIEGSLMTTKRSQRLSIELDAQGAEIVPGILQVPAIHAPAAPVAGVVLLHGFTSRKERMADSIGRVLLKAGIATLAIDLPSHGAREGRRDDLSLRNPLALVQKWKLAVREANAAVSFLAAHPAVDAQRLAIAGYSVGAFLALAVAANNTLIRAVALAAGGDLPEQTPFVSLVRAVADPRRAARALAGRPLLMINGRRDRTVTPAQALSLFDGGA